MATAPYGEEGRQVLIVWGAGIEGGPDEWSYQCHNDVDGFETALEGQSLTHNGHAVDKAYLKDKVQCVLKSNKGELMMGENTGWFEQLVEGQRYTLLLRSRNCNPFIPEDETDCCGFNFVQHIRQLTDVFSFLDVTEAEDKATDNYLQMSKYLLAGGKAKEDAAEGEEPTRMPRLLRDGTPEYEKANDETARVLPFEDEDTRTGKVSMRYLMLPETDDWYEVEHRNFLKNRIRIEMKDTAKYCVWLFYLSILEFCFGIIIMGVGSIQLGGGSDSVVIASFTSGSVMALSSVLGFLGSLSAHENFIQRFMVSALLTMSFLTTYLYVEISFLEESEREFGANDLAAGSSTADAASGASDIRAEISLSLIFAAIALFITFMSTYTCTQALDAINDLGTLQDDALVFRYFQVRFTELKKQVEHMAAAANGEFKSITRTDASPAVKPGDTMTV